MMSRLQILLHVYIRVFIQATTLKYTQIFFFWSANQTRTGLTRCPRLHAATHTRQVIKTLAEIQLHSGRYRHVKIWVYCHLSEACRRGLLQLERSAPVGPEAPSLKLPQPLTQRVLCKLLPRPVSSSAAPRERRKRSRSPMMRTLSSSSSSSPCRPPSCSSPPP